MNEETNQADVEELGKVLLVAGCKWLPFTTPGSSTYWQFIAKAALEWMRGRQTYPADAWTRLYQALKAASSIDKMYTVSIDGTAPSPECYILKFNRSEIVAAGTVDSLLLELRRLAQDRRPKLTGYDVYCEWMRNRHNNPLDKSSYDLFCTKYLQKAFDAEAERRNGQEGQYCLGANKPKCSGLCREKEDK